MAVLTCSHLVKRFDQKVAIDDVSFDVRRGEIVGLLGPNGAGKTTLIRMIIDIFPPDEGQVLFLGRHMGDRIPPDVADHRGTMRDLLGYLPEERGLYRRARLAEVLEYLGQLRGLTAAEARRRVAEGLQALGLEAYANRRVIDLSKGMTQRAQFLAASVHRPQLMILDEPFSGLDPVGVHWALDQIRSFHRDGATILLSAHQMAMVEQVCDRVVMINQGRRVLYGTLDEIRAEHARDWVQIATPAPLDELVADLSPRRGDDLSPRRGDDRHWQITLDGVTSRQVLERLVGAGVEVRSFAVGTPTLEEIFLEVVRRGREART